MRTSIRASGTFRHHLCLHPIRNLAALAAVISVDAVTALERAFQLAKSGEVAGLTEIAKAVRREGYSSNQIEGPSLKRQLTNRIRAART